MTTLVTGAGVIGARAVELLVARGERVAVFDREPQRALLDEAAERVAVVRGDLRRLPDLLAALREHRPERVLHTAALLTPAGEQRPVETIEVNVLGTANVLEAARLAGVARVVFCSSVVVYDATSGSGAAAGGRSGREEASSRAAADDARDPHDGALGEDHPCTPRTVYAITKLTGEQLGRRYAERFGLEFVALRLAAVYGPALRPGGGVSRVIHDALVAALRDGRAEVRRRWRGAQELLYARDAAAALVAAAAAPRLLHDTFNVGSGALASADDVATEIARVTGAAVRVVEAQGEATPQVPSGALDCSRARDELGYAPRYDLARGLEELAAWLRAHALAAAPPS